MKFLSLHRLELGLRPLQQLLQPNKERCSSQSYTLPQLPSLEWELRLQLEHNRSMRNLAKFFFGLGLTALICALSAMLWQTLPFTAV